jgi:uncharacterized cupredoxin-like copper-binding protein
MNKKFIAGVLALSMVVTSGIPVFAGSKVDKLYYDALAKASKNKVVSGTSIVKEPTLEIDVPTSADDKLIVINPYNIKFDKAEMKDKLNGADVSGNYVISAVREIKNLEGSDVGVKVQIADFKVGSGKYGVKVSDNTVVKQFPVNLVGSSIKNKENKPKSLYLRMILKGDADGGERILKPKQDHKKKVGDATILDGSTTGKKYVTIAPGKSGSITFDGDVNANPVIKYKGADKKSHSDPDFWTGDDNVTISYKLIITPMPNE